jgi:hypothetical protein
MTREVGSLDPGDAVPHIIDRVVDETSAAADDANVNATVAGIDPSTWQLVWFRLWNTPPHTPPGDRCTVLHRSRPHRRALPSGRVW